MDAKIMVPQISAPTWAREDVTKAVEAKLAEYKGVVYTQETVKNAKADRAELNKLAKALEDERKRVKALYNAPYETFETEIKAVVRMIADVSTEIDHQVKIFEEAERKKKLEDVQAIFNEMEWHGIRFEQILQTSWLNASTSLASVRKEMEKRANQISTDLDVLNTVEEFKFEAIERYKKCLSLAMAMNEVQEQKRLAIKKAEYEAKLKADREAREKEVTPSLETPKEETSIAYDDDGLPDFSSIKDDRHSFAIHTKVTSAEEKQIIDFLQSIGVEFYTLGGETYDI